MLNIEDIKIGCLVRHQKQMEGIGIINKISAEDNTEFKIIWIKKNNKITTYNSFYCNDDLKYLIKIC